MIRKYIAILGVLALLILLIFNGTFHVPTISAQEGETGTKISSLLSMQVDAKLRALEQSPLEESRAGIQQEVRIPGGEVDLTNKQRIFIHSVEELSQSQVEKLETMGLTLYLDSWIPPLEDHPTGFIIADMPLDKLNELAEKNYVTRLDTAERVLEPHNDLAIQKINADDVWALSYNGTGVTIAVLDSGLDVTHNDIPTPTASKDYSNYPTLDDTIANIPGLTGHGTHVTGSALGRGTQSSGTYNGTAPGADLVFLKIGGDTTSSASTAAVVNAMKAAVDTYNADIITISYGGWHTYQDGTSQESQAVDYAVTQGAVVFASAGNSANDDQHYSDTVSASSNTSYIRVDVTNAGIDDTYIDCNLVWYDGTGTSNDLELEYYNSSYAKQPSTNYAQTESSRGTESEFSYYNYYFPSGSSTWYLKVKNNSTNSQFFHIYIWGWGAGSVTFQSPDPGYTIESPANADSAIAVGAYTTRTSWTDYKGNGWTYGETLDTISSFSSRGPRVDTGAPPKPNIVAPGSAIISCRDNDVYPTNISPTPWYDDYIIDNDGLNLDGSGPADYYVMQGTSMACPITAGVAALILEKNSSWTPAQIKKAIENTTTDKGSPGFDTTYGYGLVDALAAVGYDANPPTMESIVESQGQYYNTVPVLSNFGFDDDTALDDGWYQMDSYTGTWLTLFTDNGTASWDNDGWTIPGFGGLSEGSHTIYFKASDNNTNIEGESGEWSWQFYKDTVLPTDPTSVSSPSHTLSTWSSDNTVDISWTDATDATSLLDGYSIQWDTNASATPDQTKDIEEGVQSANSTALSDGSSHYFHIRSVDNAGNWQSTVHVGPFYIETVPPTDPTSVNSTSHSFSTWSSDNTVDIGWIDATDATSGLDGYSVLWDTNASTIPNQTLDLEETVQSANSTALADGNSHYFHIRSVDNAGNWQSTVHVGPFFIDTTAPTDATNVSSTSHTVSTWSSDNIVVITWTDATDSGCGLDGYSILWSANATSIPDQTKDIEEGVQTTTSSALADSDSHYFHITSADNLSNWQSTVHLGPFYIAVNYPILSDGTVSPASGGTSANFTYSANYTDFKNDAPSFIRISIDSGASENMTVKPGQTGNFTDGKIYEYWVLGSDLGVGSHTFQFFANDGTDDAIGDIDINDGPTVTSPPRRTGGGGGGGGAPPPGVTKVISEMSSKGKFRSDVTCKSEDEHVGLFIAKDTIGKRLKGGPLYTIKIVEAEDPPPAPEQTNFIGLVYDLSPEGTTFDPPVDLTIRYDESLITEGVNENSLIIATWDKDASKWAELESTVDPENNTVTTKIDHFTEFTILVHTRPADFTGHYLSVTPKEVNLGESVSISIIITNSGDLTGSYEVKLKIDNVVVQTKEVTLTAGSIQNVTFSVTSDIAGTCSVDINGLTGSFVVKEEVPLVAEEEILPIPAPMPAPIPTPAEAPPVKPPFNLWLIGGIIASCVVVIGLLVYFFVWRKRSAPRPS